IESLKTVLDRVRLYGPDKIGHREPALVREPRRPLRSPPPACRERPPGQRVRLGLSSMSILLFTLYLLIGSTVAGLVGALTGLGGGVLLVPMLILLFHVNVHYAVGASLISVIATSSGASAAYIREGYTNLRIATFLLVATVAGALLGALLAEHLHGRIIAIIFGVVLVFSAYLSLRRQEALEEE